MESAASSRSGAPPTRGANFFVAVVASAFVGLAFDLKRTGPYHGNLFERLVQVKSHDPDGPLLLASFLLIGVGALSIHNSWWLLLALLVWAFQLWYVKNIPAPRTRTRRPRPIRRR